MSFKQQKSKQLSRVDKSNIGKWDSKIKGLCEKLNKSAEYYTTSSCAGRIVLLKQSDSKIESAFLFRSHKKIGLGELQRALASVKAGKYKGLVEFQQTSCILHVACRGLSDAEKLLKKAKFAGWKRSGIMAAGSADGKGRGRVMLELLSTESISFPIMNGRKVLVSDDFLKIIVVEANRKLEKSWKKIDKLQRLV